MVKTIIKRDGREEEFESPKITRAIYLAAKAIAEEDNKDCDYSEAEILTDKVIDIINDVYKDKTPSVEEVQDIVIQVLKETGHHKTLKRYEEYRENRNKIREKNKR